MGRIAGSEERDLDGGTVETVPFLFLGRRVVHHRGHGEHGEVSGWGTGEVVQVGRGKISTGG